MIHNITISADSLDDIRKELGVSNDGYNLTFEQIQFVARTVPSSKITAIKHIRNWTGCALKTAKEIADLFSPPRQ